MKNQVGRVALLFEMVTKDALELCLQWAQVDAAGKDSRVAVQVFVDAVGQVAAFVIAAVGCPVLFKLPALFEKPRL